MPSHRIAAAQSALRVAVLPTIRNARAMTKKTHPIGHLAAILLLAALSAPAAAGSFTPACARFDLAAHSVIEQHGMRGDMPTLWLANAGLNHLRARGLCLAGAEDKAIALYRRIIDRDMSLPDPGTVD